MVSSSSSGCPGGTHSAAKNVNGTLLLECVANAGNNLTGAILFAEIGGPILGVALLLCILVWVGRACRERAQERDARRESRERAAVALECLTPPARADFMAGAPSDALVAELVAIKHAEWAADGSRNSTRALCNLALADGHAELARLLTDLLNDTTV